MRVKETRVASGSRSEKQPSEDPDSGGREKRATTTGPRPGRCESEQTHGDLLPRRFYHLTGVTISDTGDRPRAASCRAQVTRCTGCRRTLPAVQTPFNLVRFAPLPGFTQKSDRL